jgi:hypothetical protein
MEKSSWAAPVKNQVLRRLKEERSILHTIKRRKVNWIGHILRRDCVLKHVIGGKIEGTRRYWNLKQETLAPSGGLGLERL